MPKQKSDGVPGFAQGVEFMALLREKLGRYGFVPQYVESQDILFVYEIASKWRKAFSPFTATAWGEDYKALVLKIVKKTIGAKCGLSNPKLYRAFKDVEAAED